MSGSAPHVLQDYALLADGERGALVSPRGDISWCCAPGWDSPSVFTSLIGGTGAYGVTPMARFVWGGYYEPGTLIWRSRWVTDEGIIECREALAFPGEPGRVVLLRRIMASKGQARVRVLLEARGGYGSDPFSDIRRENGIWLARSGSLQMRWQGASTARPSPRRTHRHLGMELTVPEGRHHDLVLEIASGPLISQPIDAQRAWDSTEAAWEDAVPQLDHCLSPADARHSYAVLRGLTTSSGGMVAAATTSLPERSEAGRNYDYRYVWIRDQCYAGHAMAAIGDTRLLGEAVRFVSGRLLEDGDQLSPAYTATGAPVPDQRQLQLPGYPGGFDRVGNWVNGQFQLDAFGESLLLFADASRHGILDDDGLRASQVAAAAIAKRWREPDAGIWEIDNQPWTHSRLTAAAGLRACNSALPEGLGNSEWLALAGKIVADTSAHATHPDGYWQRSPTDANLDGALLLPAIRGAIPADDPRSVATIAAYSRALTEDGYAYRFRQADGPLSDSEGSFTLCGFLMALANYQQGDLLAAQHWWERTRSSCGPPGLFSEEYDAAEQQMRGNLPQAFVHALLLETASALGEGGCIG
jgi:GH15 family glucan-1,4-alpha-glucosidase